ncbi:cell division protein FtsQ/DivIB [Filifactor villosus]|uniref:FtsQ-type POTRA domain-containing protein n=1 Tax=Filifactor villosus TaxID=29374 RepID=A0ABV9QMA6_9FIRM
MKSNDEEKKMQEQIQAADPKKEASSRVTKEEECGQEADKEVSSAGEEVQKDETGGREKVNEADEEELKAQEEVLETDREEEEPSDADLKEEKHEGDGSEPQRREKKSTEDTKPRERSAKKGAKAVAAAKKRGKFRAFKLKRTVIRRLKLILPICILLLLATLFTPLYKPKGIVILGNNDLKEEDIIKMGKIPMDKSIYLLRSKQIEQNLSEDPYVKSAGVSKRFPNILIVDMNIREEVATVNFQEGFVIIDYTGHILRIEQDVKNIVKPLITGLKEADMLKVGDKLEQAENSNFQMILDLISNVQNAGLIHNISEMNLQDEENIFLITTQGLRVLLGRGDDLTYKLNQLSHILVDLHTKKINYGIIDMRYDSYPVYREN